MAPKAYDRAPLLPSEHRASTWYLLNGWFVHMFLGGLVGCFHKLCLMDRTHGLTDRRYTYDFHDDRGSIVRFVGLFDLFVLGPLCVILFVVYQVQGPIRDVLEVSVCTMQLYGNLIVVGGEMVDGFVHVWRGWTLTLDSVLYFWLLFALVKSIWFLVPLLHGIPAFARVVSACSQSHEFRTIKVD